MEILSQDTLIRLFERHQLLRKGDQVSFAELNQIRSKLRFVARLVKELHSTTGDATKTLTEFLHPRYYDDFVTAVLSIREINKQMAFTLGHYIKKLCYLKLSEAIKKQDGGNEEGNTGAY